MGNQPWLPEPEWFDYLFDPLYWPLWVWVLLMAVALSLPFLAGRPIVRNRRFQWRGLLGLLGGLLIAYTFVLFAIQAAARPDTMQMWEFLLVLGRLLFIGCVSYVAVGRWRQGKKDWLLVVMLFAVFAVILSLISPAWASPNP